MVEPEQELQRLQEALLVETQSRQRDVLNMQKALQQEIGLREGSDARAEEQLKSLVKQESVRQGASSSSLEAKLSGLQKEVRMELKDATAQNQDLSQALAQLRESLFREMDARRSELATVRGELEGLATQLRLEVRERSVAAPQASPPEALIQEEVRKQLQAERLAFPSAMPPPQDSQDAAPPSESLRRELIAHVEERLTEERAHREQALAREAQFRTQAQDQFKSMCEGLIGKERESLKSEHSFLENKLQSQVMSALQERLAALRSDLQSRFHEEKVLHEEALKQEARMREEADNRISGMIEGTIEERCKNSEMMEGLVQGITASLESTVTSVVTSTSQDISAMRKANDGVRVDVTSVQKAIEGLRQEWRAESELHNEEVARLRTLVELAPKAGGGGMEESSPAMDMILEKCQSIAEEHSRFRRECHEQQQELHEAINREAQRQKAEGHERMADATRQSQASLGEIAERQDRVQREIVSKLNKVDQDLDAVKRQLCGEVLQRESIANLKHDYEDLRRRLESRVGDLADRVEEQIGDVSGRASAGDSANDPYKQRLSLLAPMSSPLSSSVIRK